MSLSKHFTSFSSRKSSKVHKDRQVSVDKQRRLASALLPVVEAMEQRVFLDATPTLTFPSYQVPVGTAYTIGLASNDDLGEGIDHWTIYWGDGSTVTYGGDPSSETYTYTAAGDYAISADVVESGGGSTYGSNYQIIMATQDEPPTVSLSSAAPAASLGMPVSINATANYSPYEPFLTDTDTVDHYTVDWGDGNTQSFSTSATSGTFNHIYASVGTYSVTATVTDNDTTSASSSALSVSVNPVTPEAPGGNGDGQGVDLFSGAVGAAVDGPSSGGFGLGFDASSSWGNDNTTAIGGAINGNGTLQNSLPQLLQDGTNTLALQSGGSTLWFDYISSAWVERYGGTDTLSADGTGHQYIYGTSDGTLTNFYDFTQGGLSGKIKSLTDSDGNSTTYNYNGSSQLTSVVRENVTGTVHTKEAYSYTYLTSGSNSGKLSSISLGRKSWDTGLSQTEPGSYSTVRSVNYTYYGSGVTGGNLGDLEMAQTEDASSNVLDTQFMRYYVSGDSDTHGYVGALKYVLNTESYNRLAASLTGGTTPATATDSQVAAYADKYYQYNAQHQATEAVAQGDGSSASTGLGTTTYSHAISSAGGSGYNAWVSKTAVTDPSGTTTTSYFNAYGEQMLSVISDGTNLWGSFTEYDSSGRPILTASPSAVSIPSLATIEGYSDLLHNVSGNYQYLNDSTGLISTTSYYSTTSATSSTAGGVKGYVSDTYIKHGETGTAIHQSDTTYYAFTAGNASYDPIAASTTYSDEAGSLARTTSYSYTMYSSTVQPKLETVTQPNIDSSHNGSNSADTSSTFFDLYGRPIWTKDGDGHVNYTAYDQATGAVIKSIMDVNYGSLSTSEQTSYGLTGWSTSISGLNLVTTSVVDSLGRTTKTTSPAGNVSYTVYNDTSYETRTYPGWQTVSGTATSSGSTTTIICTSLTGGTGAYIGQTVLVTAGTDSGQQSVVSGWNASTHTFTFSPAFPSATTTSTVFTIAGTTGPIQISREYRPTGGTTYLQYSESLSISAAPHLASDGTPDGSESITNTNIQSLSRSFTNNAGQPLWSDQYFLFAGLTYSQNVSLTTTAPYVPIDLGTAGTNYYRTTTGYDSEESPNYSLSPTGTITHTVYDALGRVISKWTGTTDTHTGSEWTPSTNTGNMMKIEDDQYDGGGMGDGNLTQVTQHIDTSSGDDRVTQYLYDWRDRKVVSKSGVLSSETDSAHRPITYTHYDNLGEVTETDSYDGDGVSLSGLGSSGGVPNAPTSSLLRSKSTSSYDDQGRVYESATYSVDQSSGTVGNALTTDTFYDHRGEQIAVLSPGGQVSKSVYDGAGRVTTQYTTDGGAVNNSGVQQKDWTHAGSVSSDVVLTQTETTYDADGNAILITTRDRFHDDATSSQGGLGTPSSGIHARVSYMASYYDAGDRLTDSVNVGTNEGSAYTRPGTVPATSDTVLVTQTDYDPSGRAYLITDRRGILNETFYDMLGRTLETINDTTITSPTTGTQITEYTYDGAGHTLTMIAHNGGGNQTTAYVYGVGGTSGTNLFSNDLIQKVEYPNASTGAADTTAAGSVSYTYNLLGQQLTMVDQNGTTHTYTYDILGRQISDAIAVASGNPENVDTSIGKHATNYNALGLRYQATSYNTSNAVVNQVQYGYNGFGQETIEYQEHSGSVSTSTSAKIQYAYVDGTGNIDRLTSQTFNNGRILDYGYNSGLDADISRVSYMADDGGTSAGVHLENYSYLGLDTVVKRGHPETGVDQTLIGSGTGDGGDQYLGLDRFGRVILQNWTNGTTSSDEYEYAYDRNGNALYQKNDLSSVNSELYHANASTNGDNNSAYDTLNRLTGFSRGTLSASAWNSSVLDTISTISTGFTSHQETWTLDAVGNWSSQTIDGSATNRVHNKKNQATTVGSHNLTFDNDGNTTTDNVAQTYIYDAWNHIIQVKDNTGTTIVTYSYDANQRRATAVSPGVPTRNLYYDTQWRIIEEYSGGTLNDQNIFTVNGYIDDVVLVDHDATTGGSYGKTSSGLDQRLYEMQDGQHRSTGLVNTSGSVVERFQYDPYGNLTDMNGSWGTATTGYGWEFLWKGMRLQTRDDIYYVRHRDYSPTLGRFLQEDPTRYADGTNLYRFTRDNPVHFVDPLGTASHTATESVPEDGSKWYEFKDQFGEVVSKNMVNAFEYVAQKRTFLEHLQAAESNTKASIDYLLGQTAGYKYTLDLFAQQDWSTELSVSPPNLIDVKSEGGLLKGFHVSIVDVVSTLLIPKEYPDYTTTAAADGSSISMKFKVVWKEKGKFELPVELSKNFSLITPAGKDDTLRTFGWDDWTVKFVRAPRPNGGGDF